MTEAGRGLGEQRKLVSVVFADVVGSTAFGAANDAEAVRSVMGAYFERMKQIAELHGGTVEKFIGDAVMVVFGVPRLHDDDAERAVRAALAMREAMVDLNRELGVTLAARVGVNSGEAVAGSGREGQFLVTGDVVNVAARLQQGAEPGEVIVGALTESLTRAAIEYATHAPVAAKGKDQPIQTHRALRPRSAIPEQARGLPAMRAQLVGRQRELRLLLDTFERVRNERRAHLFTLVGNAGIGKSRLVGEFLARVAGREGARVLRGRVLPYGAGITYWPLTEIVREDAGITAADDREAALAKLDVRCAERLDGDAATVRQRLAVMLGLRAVDDALPEVRPEAVAREIAWAVREYLAALAREPAVIVIDDLQWAEPAVFEIIEGLSERAEDAPLFLLCVARPQLLESRAGWAAGRANAATITLDALSADETAMLISRLLDVDRLPYELRARVVKRSEGNPLFCEEFLRMLIDDGRVERVGDRWRATAGAADVRVPESIHALLGARLDGLGDEERRLMQIASIVGERFGAAEVSALAPGLDVTRAISGLRRSGLVLEDHQERASGRYRFKHLLMRDVAYAALSKAARADLHEAFAHELEGQVGDRRDEFAEIVAHHIERAFALSAEIRAPRPILGARARAALDRGLLLAERARRRQDAGLLRPYAATARAALEALGDAASEADRLAVTLSSAEELSLTRQFAEARARFEEAARLAAAMSRPDLGARAHLGAAQALVYAARGPDDLAAITAHIADADRLFGEAGDPGGQIEAGLVALEVLWARGEVPANIEKARALYERACAIGDRARELQLCARLAPSLAVADRREEAAEFLRRTDMLVRELGARQPPWSRVARCGLLRNAGELGTALACYAEFPEIARIEQDPLFNVAHMRNAAEVVVLEQRRYAEGHEFARRGVELSVKLDEWWNRGELTGMLGVTTAALGDVEGGFALIDALGDRSHDVYAAAFLFYCRARILEIAGRVADADAAYRKSGEMIAATGFARALLNGLIRADHAQFLQANGRLDEALAHLTEAEAMVGPQTGERAERLRALRERITAVTTRAKP